MRALMIMVVVVAGATGLGGCRDKKPQPVPGPQSARSAHDPTADSDCPEGRARRAVSEISWFQGTLEEAFARHAARHTPKPARPLIRY